MAARSAPLAAPCRNRGNTPSHYFIGWVGAHYTPRHATIPRSRKINLIHLFVCSKRHIHTYITRYPLLPTAILYNPTMNLIVDTEHREPQQQPARGDPSLCRTSSTSPGSPGGRSRTRRGQTRRRLTGRGSRNRRQARRHLTRRSASVVDHEPTPRLRRRTMRRNGWICTRTSWSSSRLTAWTT